MIRPHELVLQETPQDVAELFDGRNRFPEQALEESVEGKKGRKRRVANDKPTVHGPIPVEWLHVADTCGRQGLSVAVAIWSLIGSEDAGTVRLTREVLSRFDVPESAAPRILKRMQQKGLCEYQTKRGQGAVEVRLLLR